MMKLLSGLFNRRRDIKAPAGPGPGRYAWYPYMDILSDETSSSSSSRSSRSSSQSSSPSRSTLQRVELRRPPCVDQLLEAEQQKLQEAFRIIDRNGDGKISQQELGAMWVRLGVKVTNEELRFMVEEADSNGDGEIDLEEFVTLSTNIGLGEDDPAEHTEELRVVFNVADADRDGYLSAADLQTVMKRLGEKKATIAETSAMLRCADSDGDSLIDFQDFERLMNSSILANKR